MFTRGLRRSPSPAPTPRQEQFLLFLIFIRANFKHSAPLLCHSCKKSKGLSPLFPSNLRGSCLQFKLKEGPSSSPVCIKWAQSGCTDFPQEVDEHCKQLKTLAPGPPFCIFCKDSYTPRHVVKTLTHRSCWCRVTFVLSLWSDVWWQQ